MENEKQKEIRYADLFGGVGGFRLGIERASNLRWLQQTNEKGENCKDTKEQRGMCNSRKFSCVFYCDIDKYAVQTYNKNFNENHESTDIRTIKTDSIPEIDMLCGGFPCQAFSIAGKRRGFKDTRGTLFFEIARIIKAKRPKIVFLENVKGLLNHNKGETFYIIIQTLSELGYDVQWMVLNSKFFGVPQNRERVFIIGSLRGTSRPEILPFGCNDSEIDDLQGQQANTITERYEKAQATGSYLVEGKQHAQVTHNTITEAIGRQGSSKEYLDSLNKIQIAQQGCQAQRVFNPEGIAPTLRGLGGGQGAKTGLYAVLTPDRENKRQHGRRFKEDGEPSFTLTGQDVHGVMMENANAVTPDAYLASGKRKRVDGKAVLTSMHERRIRRLTPIECERLQGFSDGHTEGVSDTQRYKQMGNAVTVNVIQAIAEKLLNSL